MTRVLLVLLMSLCAAPFARAQAGKEEYPLHIKKTADYGIPKSVLDISQLKHCKEVEGRWPLIRINTATIRSQKCFRDDNGNDGVTVVSLFDSQKKFVVVLGFMFALKDAKSWLLVSEGVEERGEVTKKWRIIPDEDIRGYLMPRADNVFRKLCTHYKLKCFLMDKK